VEEGSSKARRAAGNKPSSKTGTEDAAGLESDGMQQRQETVEQRQQRYNGRESGDGGAGGGSSSVSAGRRNAAGQATATMRAGYVNARRHDNEL
jgi:hypothetical protein